LSEQRRARGVFRISLRNRSCPPDAVAVSRRSFPRITPRIVTNGHIRRTFEIRETAFAADRNDQNAIKIRQTVERGGGRDGVRI